MATRRFRVAARWLVALLRRGESAPLRLEHVVSVSRGLFDPHLARVEFDASPWGCGAILFEKDEPTEYFARAWNEADASHLGVAVGLSKHQTFWELACLALVLLQWAGQYSELVLFGDNTSSLQMALSGKSKKTAEASLLREIAWRKAKHRWAFAVAHLPTESNSLADFLSRIYCAVANQSSILT